MAIQIGFTPLPIQVGQVPELISRSEATGVDSFTNELFTLTGDIIKTDMKNDSDVTDEQVKVIQ